MDNLWALPAIAKIYSSEDKLSKKPKGSTQLLYGIILQRPAGSPGDNLL